MLFLLGSNAVYLSLLLSFILCGESAATETVYTAGAAADQVFSLPGATSSLRSNQFSGFLNITSTRFLHYMYFESERDPKTDSVIFWTNGGPGNGLTLKRVVHLFSLTMKNFLFCTILILTGCSGLLGLYTEFGPWRAGSNITLIRNPFSWTRLANIVFLEQPIGVGFSHTSEPVTSTGNQ